jgi:WXXGXW repeat (2 copies)
MNTRRLRSVIPAPAVILLLLLVDPARTQPPPAEPQAQPGVEVLARGPVHEAFAEPTTANPDQSPVVTKQPPELIEELPPDQKPEGDNVQWIPGYWAWDDEAKDFIWVSGCWRDVPPGRRWAPGHWQEVDGGWVWVAGFWATENQAQIQYLPAPPPSLDQGPAAPAPDANSMYLPGCWVYQETRYLWRPGFWTAYRPNWLWIPAGYTWTPSGYIFTDGYWDYPLDQRGLCFAPAFINRGVFLAGRRPFSPWYAVNNDFLLGSLFVHRATRHYYFGDYFAPEYAKRGFVAWPDYHPVKGAYDPTFAYYRHLHAADKNWEPAFRNLYTERRNGTIPVPPRTLAKQIEAINAIHANNTANVAVHKSVSLTHVQNVTVLTPFKEVHNTRVTNLGTLGGGKEAVAGGRVVKLEPVSKEAIVREQKAAAVMREGAQQRHDAEAKILVGGKVPVMHTDPAHVVKVDWPKLPAAVGTPQQPMRVVPPAVTIPKHEERAIPKYEPPHLVGPPKKGKP